MFENKEKHPSYATLQFSRVSSSGVKPLFGSSIKHRDTIVMRVRKASLCRHLNEDYIFGDQEIIEVEMSQSQFAEAITSMNQGSGIPVTLTYLQGEGIIEDCPYFDKRMQFENEFADKNKKQNELASNLIKETQKLFDEKKTFNKADKENVLNMLYKLQQEIGSNTEFIYKQFNEQMDKTTMEAKGEIEAFMQNKINTIANMALVEHKEELTKLNNPIDL
jgi:hypothetical protein